MKVALWTTAVAPFPIKEPIWMALWGMKLKIDNFPSYAYCNSLCAPGSLSSFMLINRNLFICFDADRMKEGGSRRKEGGSRWKEGGSRRKGERTGKQMKGRRRKREGGAGRRKQMEGRGKGGAGGRGKEEDDE